MTSNQRKDLLNRWVRQSIAITKFEALQGDASIRRYFRAFAGNTSYIAVDAPPEHENTHAFVAIAHMFAQQGLKVPEVLAKDLDKGFLLLSDLGDQQLLQVLSADNANRYYHQAFAAVEKIQLCQQNASWQLPLFDEQLLAKELTLFHDWFLLQHLGIDLTPAERQMLDKCYERLILEAKNQPQACVHRDFHSRNLMVLPEDQLGLLDFQDAVIGPISYDLVSILRDCYVSWPTAKVYEWVRSFWQLLSAKAPNMAGTEAEFIRWFDWMGLQRHLKVLGIFARLYRRDNKPRYLNDIPRILRYVLFVCDKYLEFEEFKLFLRTRKIDEGYDFSGGQRQAITSLN